MQGADHFGLQVLAQSRLQGVLQAVLISRLQSLHFDKYRPSIRPQPGRLHLQLVVSRFPGSSPKSPASRKHRCTGNSIVPRRSFPRIHSGLGVHFGAKRELNAVLRGADTSHHADRLARVANPIKSTIAGRRILPAFQTADIQLPVPRIEPTRMTPLANLDPNGTMEAWAVPSTESIRTPYSRHLP